MNTSASLLEAMLQDLIDDPSAINDVTTETIDSVLHILWATLADRDAVQMEIYGDEGHSE